MENEVLEILIQSRLIIREFHHSKLEKSYWGITLDSMQVEIRCKWNGFKKGM